MSDQEFFDKNKAEWLSTRENQWVWIHNEQAEFFPSYEEAVEGAYQKGFNREPIFIKQITKSDSTPSISGMYSWAV